MKIRKNDTVLVITGKDKGKKAKVRYAFPQDDRLLVDGVNMIKRHARARAAMRQAGIIELEAPIHVSNVMYFCEKCNKPSRIGYRMLDDKKVRVCTACKEVID